MEAGGNLGGLKTHKLHAFCPQFLHVLPCIAAAEWGRGCVCNFFFSFFLFIYLFIGQTTQHAGS